MEKKYWKDMGLLALVLGLLFCTFLGGRPLSTPDEGRYVEIPREMVATGDWITPHLNGLKYFEKPVFVYWVEAIVIKLAGIQEYFLRLPIALFALLGCLATYAFGRRFYSRLTGIWAAIVLATSLLYFVFSRLILLDMVFSVFLSGSLFAGLAAVKTSLTEGAKRRLWMYLATTCMALAFLTKGLIAGFPLVILVIWALFTQNFSKLKPLYLPTSILLFLAIVVPWHVLVILENPSFFDFYFIHEHFERYFTTAHRRYQPVWFFMPVVFIGFFPWIAFLPKALKDFFPVHFKKLKSYDVELFLIIWILTVLAVFSFSQSKLIPYILPVFPPLAIIVGRYLSYSWKNNLSLRGSGAFYGGIVFALTGAIVYARHLNLLDEDTFIQTTFAQNILVGTGLLGFILAFTPYVRWMLATLIAGQILFLFSLNEVAYLIQRPSLKPLAEKIKNLYGDNVEVISYAQYYQDLPAYLNKTVKVSQWSGELDFGRNLEPENDIFVTPDYIQNVWQQDKPVCIVAQQARYESEIKDKLSPAPQEKGSIATTMIPNSIILVCNR